MSAPFICHIEWGTPDPARLENFLTQLFSWQFQTLRVTDMESMLAKAEELGAKIVVPKTSLGNGSFAFIAAPDGSLIGLQNL